MKNMYKLLLVFLLMPLVIFASDKKGKHTKTKSFNKEYKVDGDNTVKISNKYGNIDITTWSENRVVIEVVVTTNGNDEEKVVHVCGARRRMRCTCANPMGWAGPRVRRPATKALVLACYLIGGQVAQFGKLGLFCKTE